MRLFIYGVSLTPYTVAKAPVVVIGYFFMYGDVIPLKLVDMLFRECYHIFSGYFLLLL